MKRIHSGLSKIILLSIAFMMNLHQTQAQEPSEVPGHFADVNGLKMYYEIHGTGQPLVLIHGGGSTITTTFGTLLPALAKTHRVIAVEMQAHGHTADIQRPLSFEQDADDVAALLQQLKIPKAAIFGFSNGGSTAMQIAIRHPELVDKLILASAMYKRGDLYPWFWEMMQKATFGTMPQAYKDAYLKIKGNNPEGLLAMYSRDAQRMLTFRDMNEQDIRSIQAPAFVIIGDQDVVRPEGAVALFRLLPHGRLSIFPGPHGECLGEIATGRPGSRVPELLVSVIEEFLQAPMPK
jgi:pimeloyl-ACP methyl ester carboxylesterase